MSCEAPQLESCDEKGPQQGKASDGDSWYENVQDMDDVPEFSVEVYKRLDFGHRSSPPVTLPSDCSNKILATYMERWLRVVAPVIGLKIPMVIVDD
jgi:hypothetical protein